MTRCQCCGLSSGVRSNKYDCKRMEGMSRGNKEKKGEKEEEDRALQSTGDNYWTPLDKET